MPFDITSFLNYGVGGLALSLVALIVFLVRQHQATVRMFMKHDSDNDKRHDKTYRSLNKSIKENTELTKQVNDFMKNLNGELRNAAKRKIKYEN